MIRLRKSSFSVLTKIYLDCLHITIQLSFELVEFEAFGQ